MAPMVRVLKGDTAALGRDLFRKILRTAGEMDHAPLSKCHLHLQDCRNPRVRKWLRVKIFRGLEVYHPYVSLYSVLVNEFESVDVGQNYWQQDMLIDLNNYFQRAWVQYMTNRLKMFFAEPQQVYSIMAAIGHVVIPFQDFPRPDLDLKFGLREFADTDSEDELDYDSEDDDSINLLGPTIELTKPIGPPAPIKANPLYQEAPSLPLSAPNTKLMIEQPKELRWKGEPKKELHFTPAHTKGEISTNPNVSTPSIEEGLSETNKISQEDSTNPKSVSPQSSKSDSLGVLPSAGAPIPLAAQQLSYCHPKGVPPTAITPQLSVAGRLPHCASSHVEISAKGLVPMNHHVQIASGYRAIQKWHRRKLNEQDDYHYTEQVKLREPGELAILGADGKTPAKMADFTQMEVTEEEEQKAWGNLARPSIDEVVRAIKPGMILVSHPSPIMGQQFFESQIHTAKYGLVLITEHDDNGTTGIVLNQKLGCGFDRTWNFRQLWKGHEIARTYRGGPMHSGVYFLLHDLKSPDGKCKDLAPGVKLSHNPEVLKEYVGMFDQWGDSNTYYKSHHFCRAVKGCLYWYPGILANQIYAGWWMACPHPNLSLLLRDYWGLSGNQGWNAVYMSMQGEYETMVRDGNLMHMSWFFKGYGKW